MASNFDPASLLPIENASNLSWLGLVASTAFGGMEVAQLRAEVRAEPAPRRGVLGLRLIVQSYADEALDGAGRPRPHARPLASLQQSVSPAELEAGVVVDLVQLDATFARVALVAWLEEGDTQLEYDARAARPQCDSWYGVSAAEPRGTSRLRLHPAGD